MESSKGLRYLLFICFLLVCYAIYINWDVYYIKSFKAYVKIENKDSLCTVYISRNNNFKDDYIVYKPGSAEISDLYIHLIRDTFYVMEWYLKLVEVHSKDFPIVPVIRIDSMFTFIDEKGKEQKILHDAYWTDSIVFKEKGFTIKVNHRFGIHDFNK